jgi:hypothetical protein
MSIAGASIVILILHSHPPAPRQLGPYQFHSKAECERVAPRIERMNEAAFPEIHFSGFTCRGVRNDLP